MRYFLVGLALCSVMTADALETANLKSPDGRIDVLFTLGDNKSPYYEVTVGGQKFINQSSMGLVMKEWDASSDFRSFKVARTSLDENWTSLWGENKSHRNHYNEMAVTLTGGKGDLTLRFRAFDDGVAFRYELAANGCDSLTVTDELTEFRFASNGESWSIPVSYDSYEHLFRDLPINEVRKANTPFTFKLDGGPYGSIHEAALYDFPEMVLYKGDGDYMRAELAPLPDGIKAYIPSSFNTPWRTIQIAESPVALLNSSMILNLNDPSVIEDTSWIKPQKYVGVWWGMQIGTMTWKPGPVHGATTENAIRYIDFAAENDLQGVLFEGWNEGWETWGGAQHFDYLKAAPDFDIDSVASYAKSRGIELWMHNETGGNVPEYEAVLDSAFAYYQSLGVHTVKTGYAGLFPGGYSHHCQYGVRHYQNVIEVAAQHQLMIDAHEPIKDTGIRRTWPNFLTREGARGMEYNAWSDGNDADYLCILPYVRLLAGPLDYTPGIFDLTWNEAKNDPNKVSWGGNDPSGKGNDDSRRIHTTLARQIANWVIIYSPLQMAADLIENYQEHPCFEFFRTFNADIDESRALQGEIGKYIVMMRRAGDTYFLGAGTNNDARTLSQRLDFLPEGKRFKATVYADRPGVANPAEYTIYDLTVTSKDTLYLILNPSGGQAITFTPLP